MASGRRVFTCGLALAIILPAGVRAHSERRETVPFELHHNYLVRVKGSVERLEGLSFLLDTGTTNTILDRKLAARLGLRLEPSHILNFDQDVVVQSALIAELKFGPLETRNIRVLVADLLQFSELADGIDVIVGLDVLRTSNRMLVDYDSRVVIFELAAGDKPPEFPATQAMTVQLTAQGQAMRLVIDTGLQGMLLYQDRLRRHRPQLTLTNKKNPAHQGRLNGELATLPGVRFGTQERQVLAFLLRRAPKLLADDVDGYLGTRALNAKRVELDFAANTLRWY